MVDATGTVLARECSAHYPPLPQSKWIDVRSDTSEAHSANVPCDERGTIHEAQGKEADIMALVLD